MGKKPTIVPGTRYGHLVTTGTYIPAHFKLNKYISGKVECICDCGNIATKLVCNLKNGMTGSCSHKCIHYGRIIHGKAKLINGKAPKEYGAWKNMKHSCDNPSYHRYKDNGAKGITYHKSLSTIEGFLEIMGIAPSLKHIFTRLNKDGDYEPGNVLWYLKSKRK